MPHDPHAEVALVGSAFLDAAAVEHIDPSHLYDPKHRAVAEAVRGLHARQAPIELVTVVAEMRQSGTLDLVGGFGGLGVYLAADASGANAAHYAGIVAEMYRRRVVITSSAQAIEAASAGLVSSAEVIATQRAAVEAVAEKPKGKGLRHIGEAVGAAFTRIEVVSERRSTVTGLSTGLDHLDDLTAGLQPSDLIVIAGRPSSGKTALAVGMAQSVSIRHDEEDIRRRGPGALSAIFSLEMARESLAMRMIASEGRVEGTRLRVGHLFDADWPRIARAASAIASSWIYVDDTPGSTIEYIDTQCDRLAEEQGSLGLIVVDYVQLMNGSDRGMSREQVIAKNSRGLKALAKRHTCPVVELSQLNRSLEQREDKRPINSDLRESGSLEQDADVILFVYRDVVYNPETEHPNEAEIIIGKQRNGPLGTARVAFLNEFTRFENLAPEGGR